MNGISAVDIENTKLTPMDDDAIEALFESLINCQFFSYIIGHTDAHYGNIMFNAAEHTFSMIDFGNAFPPFPYCDDKERMAKGAVDVCMERVYLSPDKNLENRMKIAKSKIEKCKNISNEIRNMLIKDEALKELAIYEDSTIDTILSNSEIFKEITDQATCLDALKQYEKTLRDQQAARFKSALRLFGAFPKLQKKTKKVYLRILKDCENSIADEMQKYHFTTKEINSAIERVKELRKVIQETDVTKETYRESLPKGNKGTKSAVLSREIIKALPKKSTNP
jgi:hypothetical protein